MQLANIRRLAIDAAKSLLVLSALWTGNASAAAFDGILRTTNPSDLAAANAYLASGNVTLTINLTDTSWSVHTVALTGFAAGDTINIVRSGAPLTAIPVPASYPDAATNDYYNFPDDYHEAYSSTLAGGTLTLSAQYIHYIALGPLTYDNLSYSLVVTGLTGATSADIVYDQAPPNVVPLASNVALGGVAQVGALQTGSYTYEDGESNPEGTSTFKWYVDTATNGNTKVFIAGATASTYTPIAAHAGKYLFFCVTPLASAGASPGNETCSAASASIAATTPGAPAAPTGVAGNGQAVVSWTAPGTDGGAAVTGYRVQVATSAGGVYADAAGACAPATTTISTATSCTATGLTNGTPYFFKVSAINSVGTGSASAASTGVTPVAPASPPPSIPVLPTVVSGITSAPILLNLSGGDGPTFTSGMVALLSGALTSNLQLVQQTPQGTVVLSGFGGDSLAFMPLSFQTGDPRADGIYPMGNGQYQVVRNGQSLVIAPALVHIDQLTGLMPGVLASQADNGVITATINGVTYSVQPSVRVTLGVATGSARLLTGPDGNLHFIDAQGNDQILYPAFTEPVTLRAILQSIDITATMSIQFDGTALVVLNGQRLTLVPDLTLGTVPADHTGQAWWQEGPTRYRLLNVQPLPARGTSQGLTIRP